MPQLDLYNFFLIVFLSIIGIVVAFIYFHKYWLYSWKLLSIITTKIKNSKQLAYSLLNTLSLFLLYTFFSFNSLLSNFFYYIYFNLYNTTKIYLDFFLVTNINDIKSF